MKFDKMGYCSFCAMPGAKHEGGIEVAAIPISGVFCNRGCFDKWCRWKSALIVWLKREKPEEIQEDDQQLEGSE